MPTRVLILGAGFGGLELATVLSAALGPEAEVTLIDRSDSFVFGYSKLDLMFGRDTPAGVRIPYAEFDRPGSRVLREEIIAIDPEARVVTTDAATHRADVLVLALGADYDLDATPGLAEAGGEFYSIGGAERLAGELERFESGRLLIGVAGFPFKCPPAPSEAALLLDHHLRGRGIRERCEITFVLPQSTPVPPSPEASDALLEAFEERGVEFVPGRRVDSIAPGRSLAVLDDGSELPFDLFLGVPKHRVPEVVVAGGIAEADGYVAVDPWTLETRYPDVYAIGDAAAMITPKAGVFAEGAGRAVAQQLIARVRGEEPPAGFDGLGSCYVEFGGGRVGRVDVDFHSGPKPTGAFQVPSAALLAEKNEFGTSRRARWFA